jgi:alpha-glucosidase
MMAAATTDPLWWQRGVVYQIYPRSFQDSNGDGIGDLAGVIDRLDYFRDTLGVDAIWLSPFYPSPMADFGYDVANYVDIDPMFGDLATFDRLVTEAHRRDIHVIIDFVPNHTSDRHPWFLESRSSRDNPKRDWYIWRDPKSDGSPPNNWLAHFGGRAWEWDEHTGQYYLHLFLKEQPDLNWRNPEVKAAMFDAVRFWLERGVDGFRIDVAYAIMKDPELRDNPPNPDLPPEMQSWDFGSQLHTMDMKHPDLHSVYRELRHLLDEYSKERPRAMIGEIHVYDWPVWATYYGPNLDEFHLPFNFGLIALEVLGRPAAGTAPTIRALVDAIEDAAGGVGGWPNYVLGNHDTHRIASRVGPEGARVGMMLLLTLRGTPTLYQGDEIGMHDVLIPPDRIQDPFELLTPGLGFGRDPERTPMQWDAGPNAGFCPPGVEPWLPLADDYGAINVATELAESRSMLALTRALLALRRAHPALSGGSYEPLDGVPEDCFVYAREAENERFLVALNFGAEERLIELPIGNPGRIVVSTLMDRAERVGGEVRLRPQEGCIVGQ